MSIWTDLWNLFFPHSCLLCGRQLISGERVLCLKCLSGLPRTQFHLRKDNIVECNFWGKNTGGACHLFSLLCKGRKCPTVVVRTEISW